MQRSSSATSFRASYAATHPSALTPSSRAATGIVTFSFPSTTPATRRASATSVIPSTRLSEASISFSPAAVSTVPFDSCSSTTFLGRGFGRISAFSSPTTPATSDAGSPITPEAQLPMNETPNHALQRNRSGCHSPCCPPPSPPATCARAWAAPASAVAELAVVRRFYAHSVNDR